MYCIHGKPAVCLRPVKGLVLDREIRRLFFSFSIDPLYIFRCGFVKAVSKNEHCFEHLNAARESKSACVGRTRRRPSHLMVIF